MSCLSKQKQRRRKRLFAAIAFLLGVCVACIGAEAALRVYVATRGWTANCYATGTVFFVPHATAGHTLRPGLQLRSSTYDVSVNELGFRGPAIQKLKPEKTVRIAVLGGSSVFGYLVGEGLDSCRVLEDILRSNEHLAGKLSVEVINAGVPGFNMSQCRARFEADVAPLDPDIVLLYLGWNDSKFLIGDGTLPKETPAPSWITRTMANSSLWGFVRYRLFPPPAPKFAPPASVDATITDVGSKGFQEDLEALLASIKRAGSVPIISTQLMASATTCSGLDEYLGENDAQRTSNRIIGEWITDSMRKAANEQGLELIDVAGELPCDPSMLGDAIHPTQLGHRRIGEVWAEHLLPIIERKQEAAK